MKELLLLLSMTVLVAVSTAKYMTFNDTKELKAGNSGTELRFDVRD